MRKCGWAALLFCTITCVAQKISYGAIAGVDFYESGNSGGQFQFEAVKHSGLRAGGYVEYQFAQTVGLKGEVTYMSKEFKAGGYVVGYIPEKLNYITVSPLVKFDFGSEYRKGFYALAGPVAGIMAGHADNVDTNAVKPIYLAVSAGIGERFARFVEVEFLVACGVTPFYAVELDQSYKGNMLDASLSLNLDMERILHH